MNFNKMGLIIALGCVTGLAQAADKIAEWHINPTHSTLKFTATQNNAPVSGQFKNLSGDVQFDPKKLNQSKAEIAVDINSIFMPFQEIAEALKTADWFDVKTFPKAVFKTTQFNETASNTYQAVGEMAIRDKKIPMTITFTLVDYSPDKFHVKGETVVKRSAFGVGQGEWSDTNEVKDEVKIEFNLQGDKALKITK